MIDPAEYNSDILMSQSDRQEALDDLLFRAALETAGQEVFGSAALALVVSQGVSDPNRVIQSGGSGRTLLLGALAGLIATTRTFSSAPPAPRERLDVSLDPNALLPHAVRPDGRSLIRPARRRSSLSESGRPLDGEHQPPVRVRVNLAGRLTPGRPGPS